MNGPFLLDTHLILWSASEPERLSPAAAQIIEDEATILAFSVVSLWEIAIKNGLRRSDFLVNLRRLRRNLLEGDLREISVLSEHALALEALPIHHKDPFDRMLVAQAVAEGMTLLTGDAILAAYGHPVCRV
ncbi:type II toxin-antitoxin system VapC family toxin [Bosea sp. LjRoot237]|uniref:type II toxin-antitoxin system VapC family toxin n=1 Tax=Bosea sp. LjRoot237 TaxID=3342292 RepID=UPI003ECF069E